MKMENLAILGGPRSIVAKSPHYIWPRITPAVEHAVIKQLHKTISIYNRSGVIEEFEMAFASYHKRKHGLLSNSGTNAIFSMYEGIGLGPGDEVICPAYTFFATVSPLMHTGATPVFCDCDENGNIDPVEIEKKITSRTKAAIVTHMWGIPCDMESISSLCHKHHLLLLEDCSHAHGAKFEQRLVGTFGDAAVWSLQAQKTITGGEGGILLTDNDEIYYRALLQGHYNKRCKQEILEEHKLAVFSTTGFGLKFRAHPLAVAIALEQFSHLDEWLAQREMYATKMTGAFNQFTFLKTPALRDGRAGWYAYVMQFDPMRSNGINIESFTKAVLAEGLVEFDRPKSTSPIYRLPLFTMPHEALPRLYSHPFGHDERSFPNAEYFYENALKLPMWAFSDEEDIVDSYIKGIVKVASVVRDHPEVLLAAQLSV